MTSSLLRLIATRRAVAVVIALSMAVAAASISVGFLTDDHGFRAMLHATSQRAPAAHDLFRFVPGDPADNQLRVRFGRLPWWSAGDLRIHFLRPLTSLAFAADDRVFGAAPLGYHLVSLAWYLALLGCAALLFRRLLPPAAATVSVAVFGLSAAHVEAYAWISARHAVIAGALAAAALAVQAGRRGRWLAPVLLACALAASEAALAAVPLAIALELGRPAASRASRGWACAIPAALGIAYLAGYAALGFGTRASGGYHDPVADPLGFLGLAAQRVPILLGDAALGIPAELAHVVAPWRLAGIGVAAVGVVGLAWFATSRRRPAREPGAAPMLFGAARDAGAAAAVAQSGALAAAGGEVSIGIGGEGSVLGTGGERTVLGSKGGADGARPARVGEPVGVAWAGAVAVDGMDAAGGSARLGLGWLVLGGCAGAVIGAAGFPAGRMLVIPDLAFAAVLGAILHRGLSARGPGRVLAALLAIVHLAVAPLASVRAVHRLARRARASFAVAADLARHAPPSGRVFLIAASDPAVFLYPRSILSDVAPGALRCWSVLSAARAGHRITRTTAHSLTIDPLGRTLLDGSFDTLFRAPDRPFAVGDTAEQCGATIRITAVEAGRPARFDVTLRRTLDDPELGWLVWRTDGLARFTLPAIGASVVVPWAPGPSGVL